ELDNRGTHFYLAMYWAQALAGQTDDPGLATRFAPMAAAMEDRENAIVSELNDAQGVPMDIGGYFQPDVAKAAAAMRPSPIFNTLLEGQFADA
ncbi:MAG: NADP-dependent isocitrate dehydrogenase, partial [Phycisphaeraceae bacterium]|nr:NADP-dependent isocitrate dehydrogenase [Phycisphaeraceae bacterium]